MTHDTKLSCEWKVWMASLGYNDKGLDTPIGIRVHSNKSAMPKSALLDYSITTTDSKGKTKSELIPFLDIMHHVFRYTLFMRVGNFDMVHSYLVDLLLVFMKQKGLLKERVAQLDV